MNCYQLELGNLELRPIGKGCMNFEVVVKKKGRLILLMDMSSLMYAVQCLRKMAGLGFLILTMPLQKMEKRLYLVILKPLVLRSQ